jgi:hypothetical protein
MMTKEAVELAARAWSICLMMHSSVDANDQGRCSSEKYVQKKCDEGEHNDDEIVTAGFMFLKRLDLSGDLEARP